jgi:hypothetical protein
MLRSGKIHLARPGESPPNRAIKFCVLMIADPGH